MKKTERYTVTAALPYANGPLHIGHIAGCYLPADIYVRYLRNCKKNVLFICGSDEHGVPITLRAVAEGISPQQVVDKYHHLMKDTFEKFGISFSYYGRTSDPIHHETSQYFFKSINDAGIFSEIESEQYFDPKANRFLADRYIMGTCPKCSNNKAYGDQCEVCGTSLSPDDLINPVSALSGEKPIKKNTKNWYLPLDELQEKYINQYIKEKKDIWKPNVYGQCISWLEDGLKPRAMTRDLDWGVKVPLEGQNNKVLYVWFDAPIGYISSTQAYFHNKGNPEEWKEYWIIQEDSEQKLIHFIGKDNIVFHCIIFPATLMCMNSTGKELYILPQQVPANEFLNLEGEKISTSRNHAVWLHEYLEDFPDRTDELRYYLTSIAPETSDSDFTWKGFQLSVNSELVSIFANFVNRVMVLTHKFFNGVLPPLVNLKYENTQFINYIIQAQSKISDLIEHFKFREAQNECINLFRFGNQFLTKTEPWHLIKSDTETTGDILHILLQFTARISFLCEPFLPVAAGKIQHLLNIKIWSENGIENFEIPANHLLNQPEHIYKPIQDSEIEFQISKINYKKENNTLDHNKPALKSENINSPLIEFDDFSKIDIRVVEVLHAENIKKTDKLMQLLINTGTGEKTVVSGIAHQFSPNEIIGKKLLWLSNLSPRKLKGIESHGMILMASNPDGKLVLINPPTEAMVGSKIS